MRRVLTILTAILLLVVSLGIGVFTADLPFWQRALQLPLPAGEVYLPAASIGAGEAQTLIDSAAPLAFDELMIEEAANRARGAGSRALLVLHEGRLVIERYFVADDVDSMLPATVIARPLAAMAAGVALADGTLKSLDAPVAALLHEWDDEPRGRITLRQLLEETSGLEDGNTIAGVLYQSPWQDLARLPRFATARGVRMWLGNDYESSALGFRLNHESGGFYNVSPANAQLVAVMLERATGQPYERFVETRIWSAAGAGTARLQLDRRAGMPAAHCCWLATARDMLRIATLLATDGNTGNRQVLPAGWVAEMAQPSRVNADSGMQLRRLKIEGEDALSSADDQGSAFWVIPSRQLVVLDIATHGEQPLDELPALVLRALVAQ